jgi:hypothetical protein
MTKQEERRVTDRTYELDFWLLPGLGRAATKGKAMSADALAPKVEVIKFQHVGGYDTTVLQADNMAVLEQWLQSNKYIIRPDVTKWLAPYVDAHWKITAFKISKPTAQARDVSLAPVRMSFATDRPFYPYREPAQEGDAAREFNDLVDGRLLRIFLMSDARMNGALGSSAGQETWRGNTIWADHPTKEDSDDLARELSLPAGQFGGQALQQQFQLVLVHPFVALTAEVMADILVELLAQQPVLRLQRGDTRTHLVKLLEERGVRHLALTRTQNICSKMKQYFLSADTNPFSTALPDRESTR